MVKNGEIYQVGNYKYLIISDKAEPYIGCLITDIDKRKMFSNVSYHLFDYGSVCLEYTKYLNTEELTNNIGKIDDDTFSEIKLYISQMIQGDLTL